jgi:hypothetical protein
LRLIFLSKFRSEHTNPKHKRHKEFREWGGSFDPEKFDAQVASKEMRKGLPDWRNEEWI